ncbi:hypothetical protein PGB28_11250 [Primorskyibacter aestuariivivens]|uniref:hypothetical protein n=1 Tax=Primorskyibacter aestuariivivens TaxID=1888912 RepID=UPI002301A519|nr:hypothetical protein [Primorskyibacter aestuariivivens]MDA7429034.1 hypothetical protein [Primorskyibacter aestuariivivens]
MVAVKRGWVADGDFQNEPMARVIVDRPGQEVILVLLDDDKVEWRVETTANSFVETILLGGNPTSRSRVELNGIPVSGAGDDRLLYVNKPRGRDFRRLLAVLGERTALDRIASFQATYTAPALGHRISRVDSTTETLALDYLETLRRPNDDLPDALRRWIDGERPEAVVDVYFDERGMALTDAQGTRRFPVPASIAQPRLPSAATYDPVGQALCGVTYGGEGFLYRVDTETGQWTVVSSLQGYDAAGVLYDQHKDHFILTGAFTRPGDILVIDPQGRPRMTRINFLRFPGLTDLYDYENEDSPPLVPRVFQDNWVLLDVTEANPTGVGRHRVYAVNLATETVRLIDYTNP